MTTPTPTPERARLAAALRELRTRTGLSLAGLAAKTTFSKSSWERYLNGRTLPPRDAVQELCRLTGEPEGRCLALWEIAESECSGRATQASPPPSSSPSPSPSPQEAPHAGSTPVNDAVHRSAAATAVLASVCAVAVGGVAAVALLLPQGGSGPGSSLSPPPSATGPGCRGKVCEGKSPMHMRCAAAPATLGSRRTASGAWMELRYSEECGTSWARMWGTRVGDRIEMTTGARDARGDGGARAGRVRSAEVRDDVEADAYVYTPMTAVPSGTVVRACFRPAAGGEAECFDGRVPG